jgi:lysophospholipase L1-like esterase
VRIVLLGDSLTWGGYGGNYVEPLRRLLPEHEFINAGVGGNTVINLLRRVERDVIAHQPDAALILVGGNDAVSYSQPKTRSYYRQGQNIPETFVSPEMFEAGYRDLLTALSGAHILPWVGLEPNEYNPTTVAALRQYNAIAARVAHSFSAPVLDLMDVLPPIDVPDRPDLDIGFILTIGQREKRGWDDYAGARAAGGYTWSFDGLHPTPEGAGRIAEAIAAFIRQQT